MTDSVPLTFEDLWLGRDVVRLTFCGVRGSIPIAGPDFIRFGGLTSCVVLAHDGEDPSLILDGGTGLRRYATQFPDQPFRGALLLGHLHLDHTMGLGFFDAAAQGEVNVYMPAQGDAAAVLGRIFGPPFFPIGPHEFPGQWSFNSLEAGEHTIGDWSVLALDIPHGGGRTFGYRISDATATIAYLSDHSPIQIGKGPDGLGEYHPAALELARDVDLLIHDAQHRADEFPAKTYLCHSAVEYTCALAAMSGAARVAMFHHDPDRTDEEIDAVVAALAGSATEVFAAAEGQVLDIGTSRTSSVAQPL